MCVCPNRYVCLRVGVGVFNTDGRSSGGDGGIERVLGNFDSEVCLLAGVTRTHKPAVLHVMFGNLSTQVNFAY